MAETPRPGPAPAASADLRRIRTRLADAGGATRRAMERLRLARVITVAAVQVVIAFIAWRVWVWRARRRRQ